MINLLKMDFKIYRFTFIIVCVYSVLFGMIMSAATLTMLCVYVALLTILSNEESNKIHLLHKSLPVTNGEIVAAKYIEAAITWIVSLLICSAAVWLRYRHGNGYNLSGTEYGFAANLNGEVFFRAAVAFSLCAVIVGIALPVIYKFGCVKGRFVIAFIWIVLSFCIPFIVRYADLVFAAYYGVSGAAMLVIAAVVIFVSYKLSVKIYGRM